MAKQRPKMNQRSGPQSGTGGGGPHVAGLPTALETFDAAVSQRRSGPMGAALWDTFASSLPPAPEGSPDTYRTIRRQPTVALARAVVHGPIMASNWSFAKADEGVPDEWRDFIRSVYEPISWGLKYQMLFGLDFGSRSFEQLYRVIEWQGRTRVGIRKFKPLRPEVTSVLVDERTGEYAGLRNGDVELDPEETLHYSYDLEDDDWYGTSRYENIRVDAWWPWKCLAESAKALGIKVSSLIPVVKGPIGTVEVDKDGNQISGYDAGVTVLNALASAKGVLVESLAATVDEIIAQPELAKLSKWQIDNYDTGSSGNQMVGITDGLRYFDSLNMRGMLRPERVATEGQHGTLAESEAQIDVGLAEGEQTHLQMVDVVNRHSVNRLLLWNYGEQAVDQVRIEPAPLIDQKKAIYRWLFTALLANPNVLDVLVSRLDLDAMAELLQIPTREPLLVEDDEIAALINPTPAPQPNPQPDLPLAGNGGRGRQFVSQNGNGRA